VKNAPVRTCSGGLTGTTLPDLNARSGCESGGASYTCINQQPWVVNSTFAYGFAAAKIQSQAEKDWCCACYELRFTSGPAALRTKRMIVQVTNTGGDLGDNHFDLAIPGGGFGIFDGCTKQFPGTPVANWGMRYGGVSNGTACDGLPAPLVAGCKVRFDWGLGMDNPNVIFRRVTCPAVLYNRTGCKRMY
jgi:hypothetical protein